MGCARRAHTDAGDIVVGWLTKLVLVLAVVGVAMFDAISVGAAQMNASDDASGAASAAQTAWVSSHNVQAAYDAAEQSLTNPSEQILTRGFTIDADGTVRLELRRTVTTLVLHRIGPLKKYTVVTAAGEATAPTS